MSKSGSDRAVGDVFTGFKRLVTQERVNAYAQATGDHNPVHLDEAYAATTQFGTRIAHGMLSLALVTEMLVSEFPDTWHSGGKIKVRFTAPIFPGEVVTTYGDISSIDVIHDEEGDRRVAICTVGCKKPDGTDAVTGRATVPLE